MNERLAKKLNGDIAEAQSALEKFTKDFTNNPLYALKWSDEVFKQAARLSLASQLLESVKADRPLEEIDSFLGDLVGSMARYPERSTSIGSNLTERETLAAAAHYKQMIQFVL